MMRKILLTLTCALALATISTMVMAKTTIALNPTGVNPNATGSATITVSSGEQSFDVQVGKLATATYTLFVDGNNITTFTTGKGGSAQVRFDTNPHGQVQLLPSVLNPVSNIKLVEIKAASNGEVVLNGSF